ncbi:RNA degradosome polyphosphate kinase, partial [Gemmatimonadota bacterium]
MTDHLNPESEAAPDTADVSEIGTAKGNGPEVNKDRPPNPYLNREITWLSFNGRVLQEAMDPRVPLFDRLNFLAIFASNLDEFFR